MTDSILAGLDPATLGDLLRVAGSTDFDRWQDQIRRTGGCSDPIHLTGWTLTKDKTTGETLHRYSTEHRARRTPPRRLRQPPRLPLPGLRLDLRRRHLPPDPRRTRRRPPPRTSPPPSATTPASSPPSPPRPSARSTTAPTPAAAAAAPATPRRRRALGTATRPGDVRLRGRGPLQQPRRATCGSASPTASAARSPPAPASPNANSRKRPGSRTARSPSSRSAEPSTSTPSIRLDGPDGPDSPPPVLGHRASCSPTPSAPPPRTRTRLDHRPGRRRPARPPLRWGTQLDVRPIRAFDDGTDITEQAVASYVAKYATKAAETTGTVDRRVGNREALVLLDVPDHPRRLIEACFDLDPLYPDRRLRAWAHMLGFRGHFSSKSRRYSTTLGALRQVRADYRAAQQREALGLPDPRPGPDRPRPHRLAVRRTRPHPRRIRPRRLHRPRPPTQPRNRPRSPADRGGDVR